MCRVFLPLLSLSAGDAGARIVADGRLINCSSDNEMRVKMFNCGEQEELEEEK
jgi:hypothetical protein